MLRKKTIGILGGMGPEATWDLWGRIIRGTPAGSDADHFHTIVASNPSIPDRTRAILEEGPSPLPAMIETGMMLQKAGADFLVMPCMTAHHYIEPLASSLDIPVINAFTLLRRAIQKNLQPDKTVGVIATTGSLRANLYPRYLSEEKLLFPSPRLQNEVMDIIYGPEGIKAGDGSVLTANRLTELIHWFQRSGSIAVIAGCTEIGLALYKMKTSLPVIDPLDLLAEEAIHLALGDG